MVKNEIIESLLESGDLTAARRESTRLANQPGTRKEGLLLSAKVCVRRADGTANENNDRLIWDAMTALYQMASDPQEMFDMEQWLYCEYDRQSVQACKKVIDRYIASPALDAAVKVQETWISFSMAPLRFSANIYASNRFHLSTEQMNAYRDKSPYRNRGQDSDAQIRALMRDGALQIFQAAVDMHANQSDRSVEGARSLLTRLVTRKLTSVNLLSSAIEKRRNEILPTEFNLQCLIEEAQICDWALSAFLDYGTGTRHLLGGDARGDAILELEGIYQQILKLEPSYVRPPMPVWETVDVPNGGSGGCYVATAVYGSYDCPQVWTLRRFRDFTLAKTWYGRAFIRSYYAVSPTLVKWFGSTGWFRCLWKRPLDRMVDRLLARGVEDTPYQDQAW